MKHIAYCLAAFAALAGAPSAMSGVPLVVDHVLINEVMPNALGSNELGAEWIELYNPGALDVDVSGWMVTDRDSCNFVFGNYVLPAGSVVPAGGYLQVVFPETSGICLANGGDDVTLFDLVGNEVDAVWYGNGGDLGSENAAPVPFETRSIARCFVLGASGPNLDGNNPAAEFYVEDQTTPGAENDVCAPTL